MISADTAAEARFHAGSGALSLLRLRRGAPGPLPTAEEAAAIRTRAGTGVRRPPGRPDRRVGRAVRAAAPLIGATGADELMITAMVYDPADRLSSFERIRAALARASSGAPASR